MMAHPVVFGTQYVSGGSVNLMVNKESGEYRLMEGNEEGGVFTVKQKKSGLIRGLMLQNPEKAVVAMLVKEGHAKWNAYSGNLEKMFSISNAGDQVNVSLAKKMSSNDDMDFHIKGSCCSDGNCTIYTGDSSTIIAQMRPLEKNDKVMVEICPNVDYAFVVALIAIVDAMKIDKPMIGFHYISENAVNLMFKKVDVDEYNVFKGSSEEKVFNLKSSHNFFDKQWMLVGVDEKPVTMLQKKKVTGHSRWDAYSFSGESEADPKRVFSVCKDQMFQRKTDLNVMLGKGSGAAIDYKVKGSWTYKTCTISKEDSSTKIAQMQALEDKENFMVNVYPNVDYAFVVALVAVVAAMKTPSKLKVVAAHGVNFGVKVVAVGVGKLVADSVL